MEKEPTEYLKYKEIHEFYEKRINRLQSKNTLLSHEEKVELKDLKKLKLKVKDKMETCREKGL